MKDQISPCINKTESPKTPGGISKFLLTPCRRVGLSRKWKKGGCSPFISPLSTQNSTPERKEDREPRKRKKCVEKKVLQENATSEEQLVESSRGTPSDNSNENNDITTTPLRNAQILRKKTKTLSLNDNENEILQSVTNENEVFNMQSLSPKNDNNLKNIECKDEKVVKPDKQASVEIVSKPIRTESKSKSKLSLKRAHSKSDCDLQKVQKHEINNDNIKQKEKSPNNLTKECIVVIQNRILKAVNNTTKGDEVVNASEESDSESDVPLSIMTNKTKDTLHILDDDSINKSSREGNKKNRLRNLSINKPKCTNPNLVESSQASQSSQESIDKRTILIKKSYDKVAKPSKAKSTGSITQKDIDDLRERIEMKKKLLMAKAMSIDTEELRSLIRKWQKGCQDALMELLDLMKRKLPDRQNMDYAEILQTLKIPAELVGYDSENDCFVTPEDTNVLLSTLKL